MKKRLLFIIAICISVFSFAAPWDIKIPKVNHAVWDKPLQKVRAFDDPYVNTYYGTVTGTYPNKKFNLTVQLNQSASVTWLAQVQVFGIWYGHSGYPNSADYKVFDVIFSSGQWNKTIVYSMTPSEQAYTGVMDLIYDGPY